MFGLSELREGGTVLAEGKRSAKIAIIGEAPGAHEEKQGRPFVGPAGGVLDTCLHNAQLVRSDAYITNLIKVRPYKNDISSWFGARGLTAKGEMAAQELGMELAECKANVFVPLGSAAMCALIGFRSVEKYRGYIFPATREQVRGRKVLPTIHPAATFYGDGAYIKRYYIVSDLKKAREESEYPQIAYPERKLIHNPRISFNEVLRWLDFVASHKRVCFDIEVIEFQVSCISFATSPEFCVSIPIHKTWTDEEERVIMLKIAGILENPDIAKVHQNGGAFDDWFLAVNCNILVRGYEEDTMIAHSILYPDMKKGLASLASLYTRERYWKDLAKFDSPKKEE